MTDQTDTLNAAQEDDTSQEWMDMELTLLASLVSDMEGVRQYLTKNLREKDAFTYLPNAWMLALGLMQDHKTFHLESFLHMEGLSTLEKGLVQAIPEIRPLTSIEEAEVLTQKVRENYFRRLLIEKISKPTSELSQGSLSVSEAIEALSQELEGLVARTATEDSLGLGIGHNHEMIAEKLFTDDSLTLIPTGIKEFDERTGGLAKGEQLILACPTSSGKCHGINTPIIMYGGSVKMVQDIKVGDQLMGPDSKPRNVLGTTKGYGSLYEVQANDESTSYVCNEPHVLSLRNDQEEIVNIAIGDYLLLDSASRNGLMGWRPDFAPRTAGNKRYGIQVYPIGDGDYYGFELDGDHLYLLGDFTVTHNTTFMNQLCINMALGMEERKYIRPTRSALIISLEMSEEEMWKRILANLCGIPSSKFRQANKMLGEEEKRLVMDTIKQLSEYMAASGHRLTLKGASSADIGSIRAELAAHPYDIVAIDYLNLMVEGDSLWSEMGKIARDLKILAQKRDFVVITAAQLDEDSLKIRYSRMVKEHCDMVLMWAPAPTAQTSDGSAQEVTSAYTEIFVDKGRNTGKFSFWVHFNFAYMIVNGVNPAAQLGMYQTAPDDSKNLALPGAQPLGITHQPPSLAQQQASTAINTMTQVSEQQVSASPAPATEPDKQYAELSSAGMPGALPSGVLMPGFDPLAQSNVSAAEEIKQEISRETCSPDQVASDDDIEL